MTAGETTHSNTNIKSGPVNAEEASSDNSPRQSGALETLEAGDLKPNTFGTDWFSFVQKLPFIVTLFAGVGRL